MLYGNEAHLFICVMILNWCISVSTVQVYSAGHTAHTYLQTALVLPPVILSVRQREIQDPKYLH